MNCCKNNKKIEDEYKETEPVSPEIEETVLSVVLKYKLAFWRKVSVILSLLLIVSLSIQLSGAPLSKNRVSTEITPRALASEVLPEGGVELPIMWGDLGQRMIKAGVIDAEKFEKLYERRGGMSKETQNLLYNTDNKAITINSENSGELLNLLWAFGLSNKSSILETGLITTYDGKKPSSREEALAKAGRMASTGGWSLSAGRSMNHYSAHEFISLTSEEWKLVERVASGVFRPCCNNPTHFPDCNHGMAMLGLLELLAFEGATEEEMFDIALSVNSYWFPDTYLTIAEYMGESGISWKDVDSKIVLGPEYSSGSGFARVRSLIEPMETESGKGGCGV